MLTVQRKPEHLLVIYSGDGYNQANWVDTDLEKKGRVTFQHTFTFTLEDLIEGHETDADAKVFLLGISDGGYFRINADKLGLKHDLRIASDFNATAKHFVAPTKISIFRRIDAVTDQPIVIGGNDPNALPTADFLRLIEQFPNTTELRHYARARVSRTLNDHFGVTSEAEEALNAHLDKRLKAARIRRPLDPGPVRAIELDKFVYMRDELKAMLADSESYAESAWQKKIVDLLLLLFPKYVAVLEHVHINDYYSSAEKVTRRFVDLVLVDANGAIDILEIKKPFDECLLAKAKYRDNFMPQHELSGAVMQAEKYLFHLSKWGQEGEKALTAKHMASLPKGVSVRVTNPKALLLLGRDHNFTQEQKFDFEIIRRKYANMLDVMTYDDLLRRINAVIERLQ